MSVVSIKRSAEKSSTTLTQAHEQWRERPADQRYETLEALLAATREYKSRSIDGRGKLSAFTAGSADGKLYVQGASGSKATPTHWAFAQLCARAKAPPSYLRELPTEIVASCLNHGLQKQKGEEDKEGSFLLRKDAATGALTLQAATSEKYVRVWNHEIAETLLELQNRQDGWQFPEPFRRPGTEAGSDGARGEKAKKEVPVAFASDHDMFAFMVNYARPIDLDGTLLSRGFFIENSEVGARSVRLTTFLFDFVCSNIMVWGARNVTEISMSHVGRIRDKVLDTNGEALRTLTAYTDLAESEQISQIRQAQKLLLGKGKKEVVAKLYGQRALGLSKNVIEAAYEVAEKTPRYGNPDSAWAMVNGLTEVSQTSAHMDERAKVDRAAGGILTMAF